MADARNKVHEKDPDAVKTYGVNWTSLLEGDELTAATTISSSTWDVPTGLTQVSTSNTTTTTAIKLSGGTTGESYGVTNHIVMANGDEDDVTLTLRIIEQ